MHSETNVFKGHSSQNTPSLGKIKILSTLLLLVFILSACSVNFNSGDSKKEEVDIGGVFKSVDKGLTWNQKVLISGIGSNQRNFGGTSVSSFRMDPSDNLALYYGSIANGLAYTYDGGGTWQVVKDLGAVTINDLAIDSKSKCRVYVAISNKVFKTEDCSRHWKQTYIDNEPAVKVNSILVNHFDNKIVYMGLSRGDFVKSSDYGESWKTIYRFKDSIAKILIDPRDSRKMYVVTARRGVFRSFDSGANWDNLSSALKDAESSIGNNIRDMIILNTEPSVIYLAGINGIVKSSNNGDSFEKLELITPDVKSQINSVAVNEKDQNEIYYVTNTTFYKSSDGGEAWTPQKLPTIRAGWKLLIDPENPSNIYMAIKNLKK